MPVLLDDIDLSAGKTATAKTIDPKFFSSKLTGNGKAKYGLLSVELTPMPSTTNTSMLNDAAASLDKKSTSTQHNISVSTIPMAPITRRALSEVGGTFTVPTPDDDDRFVVETDSNDLDVSFFLTPQGAKHFEDTTTGDKKLPRQFIIQYRMELYLSQKGQDLPERVEVTSNYLAAGLGATNATAAVSLAWDTNPLANAAGFVNDYLAKLGLTRKDPDALTQWMFNDYNVHDGVANQAQIWTSTKIADEVSAYITGMPASPSNDHLNSLALQLGYLENYIIPLEAYGQIHKSIEATFSEDIAATLSKQNLNLLMSHTLHHLDAIKPQLTVPPVPATMPVVPAHLSSQQLEAVTTHEPLVMDTAGAGTGKSTVLLGRVDYLQGCGVPAEDITVLSFTNIAADNISARNPDIGSMTIARMINDIYTINHPTHELSSIDTIINSIEIFYPTSQFGDRFRSHLLAVDTKKVGAFTELNTFVENNYDDVIGLLDTIKQTSLELEIVICYQKIDDMVEPAHVGCKYLIIDEVQDNSIFEFVYLLKFVTKHKQSLFIVGDASQTLFEFRSANPRALTTLEGSGVFKTFRLTTNYRSNQEILDFANVLLGGLETNQLSNIQLQANSLDIPTADSFEKAVTVDYRQIPKPSGFVTEELAGIVKGTIAPKYIDANLARGEQTAFLAFSRREVAILEATLKEKYPNKHVVNLVMDRQYPTDVFSKYIRFFWNDVLQVQPHDASFTVAQGIKNNLHKLTKNSGNKKVQDAIFSMVAKWWTQNAGTIRGWERQCGAGQVSYADFFNRLRDNMLSFEIHHNAVRQSLIQQKNRDRKEKNAEADADLIVSTVHGAKGMEFDNVVIIHKEDPTMAESSKRMYYVAFTRAMKSQYVLSYGKPVDPPIVSDYELIVDALTTRDKKARAQSLGITLDELEEIEREQNGTAVPSAPAGSAMAPTP